MYTPAALSPEKKVENKLIELDCAVTAFADIAQGICGRTRLVKAMSDSRFPLDRGVADRLIEKLDQMSELAAAVAPIPVDWSKGDAVRTALSVRLAAQIDLESGRTELQSVASWATAEVKTI
jgi:hypothetical protein